MALNKNDLCIRTFWNKHLGICSAIRNSLNNSTYDDEISHVVSGVLSTNLFYNDYQYYFNSRHFGTNIKCLICRACGEYKNIQKLDDVDFAFDSNTRMLCKCYGDRRLEDDTNYDILEHELDFDESFIDFDESFIDMMNELENDIASGE